MANTCTVYLTSITQSLTAQCRFTCLFQPRKVRRALRTDQSAVNSTLMPNCTPRMHFNDVNIILWLFFRYKYDVFGIVCVFAFVSLAEWSCSLTGIILYYMQQY